MDVAELRLEILLAASVVAGGADPDEILQRRGLEGVGAEGETREIGATFGGNT